MASPIGGNTATSVAQTPLNCSNNCGISVKRLRETCRGFAQLALRVQHEAEIVAGLGMVGLEQQQALVDARGVVEFVLPLQLFGFGEQLAGRIAGATGSGRWALLDRGAALFSIHPL